MVCEHIYFAPQLSLAKQVMCGFEIMQTPEKPLLISFQLSH